MSGTLHTFLDITIETQCSKSIVMTSYVQLQIGLLDKILIKNRSILFTEITQ